jgi:uncharacterized protein DUF1189
MVLLNPLRALYSRSFYRSVANDWRGTGFLYLFVLLLAVWVCLGLRLGIFVVRLNADPKFNHFVRQVPPIVIHKGVVAVDAPQPYRLENPEEDAYIGIDTTGQVTALPEDVTVGMLLTRDRLILKQEWETKVWDLSWIEHYELNERRIRAWIKLLPWLVGIAMPVIEFVYRILIALVLAGLGTLVATVAKVEVGSRAFVRLACVAMTASIVLSSLVWLLKPAAASSWAWWPLWGLVNVVYMGLAVAWNRAR